MKFFRIRVLCEMQNENCAIFWYVCSHFLVKMRKSVKSLSLRMLLSGSLESLIRYIFLHSSVSRLVKLLKRFYRISNFSRRSQPHTYVHAFTFGELRDQEAS